MIELTIAFSIGTSLKWFSLLLNETAPDVPPGSNNSLVGTASYSIDGADPTSIVLESPTSGKIHYNRLLFQVQNLTAEQHRISVFHAGDNETNPLTLNYLIIQNAPALVVGGTPISSSSSSPSSSNPGGFNSATSSASDGHKGSPTSAIVGGAMGGIVVIITVILFLVLLRRPSKRKDTDQGFNQGGTLPSIVEPFNAPPTALIPFRKSFAGGPSSSSPIPAALTGHAPQHSLKLTTPAGPLAPTPGNSSNQASGSNRNYNSTPGNLRSQEADELGQVPSTNLLPVQPEFPLAFNSLSLSDNAAPQRVMRHEDSGIRLPARESTLELPPLYTLS